MRLTMILILGILLSTAAASAQNTGLNIGDKAPDIHMMTPEGSYLKLSSIAGKLVLIDFWASWCGPCRQENPNVVAAYNKYKDTRFGDSQGFTVFGVSLDKDLASWTRAIQSDNLAWPNHVSDLKGWNNIAAAVYQIRGIPANVLIDGNGIIIARNLRGYQLHAKLEALAK